MLTCACSWNLRALVVLGFSAICASFLTAGDLKPPFLVDSWTTENGLPQNSIVAMTETPDGYLWLATFNGLARFDGVRFTNFNPVNTPEIPSERLIDVVVDGHGWLWIFSEEGYITRLVDGRFEFCGDKMGLNGVPVCNRGVDPDGNVRVNALDRSMAFRFGRTNFFLVEESELSLNGRMDEVVVAGRQNWVREKNQWMIGLTRRIREAVSPDVQATGPRRKDLAPWLLLPDRLLKADSGETRLFSKGAKIEEATDLLEDKDGSVFVTTWTRGLLIVAPDGQIENIPLGDKHSTALRNLQQDREGNVWVGSDVAGLYRVKRKAFQTLDRKNGLGGEVVKSIVEDPTGNIWIAHQSGVDRIAPNGQITTAEDVRPVWSLGIERGGAVLLGTFSGELWRKQNEGLDLALPGQGSSAGVRAMTPEPGGGIWVGTKKGLLRERAGKIERVDLPAKIQNAEVHTILNDRQGRLWLAIYGDGLYCQESNRWTRLGAGEGLRDNRILSLCEDADGNLWVGTALGGLNYVKDGKCRAVPQTGSGLPSLVSCIIEDDLGYLWLGSFEGIYRVARQNLVDVMEGRKSSMFTRHFGRGDGLGSSECAGGMQPTVCKARDGRLWFATVNGAAVANPRELPLNLVTPRVAIEEVRVDNKIIGGFGARAPAEITAPPGAGQIEIHFTALTLTAPEEAQFKYQLEGYDRDWIDAGRRRVAFYTKAPPGNYRFRVMAANSDGVWSERGAGLGFTALPFFWQTGWFQFLMVAAGGAFVLGAVEFRLKAVERQRARQQELSRLLIESQEEERRRIARELHDGLGQDLLLIKNRALLGLTPENSSLKQCEAISNTVSQALQQVREISNNLRPYQLDELGLTAALRGIFDKVRGASEIQFDVQLSPVDRLFEPADESHIFRIVQELTNNVLKHSNAANAKVEVWRDTALRIEVSDNGRGYATQDAAARKSGFGLRGITERVGILHGEMNIESAPGRGTTIRISLPLPNPNGAHNQKSA